MLYAIRLIVLAALCAAHFVGSARAEYTNVPLGALISLGTVNGIAKGDGAGNYTAAIPGTDYQIPRTILGTTPRISVTGGGVMSSSATIDEVTLVTPYGGDPTCVADSLGAWNAWKAALSATNRELKIPAGCFTFSAKPTLTLGTAPTSVRIRCDGPDSTILKFPNSYGPEFTLNGPQTSIIFEDCTILTGTDGGNIGLSILQPVDANCLGAYASSVVRNVQFRGANNGGGGGTNYWTTAVYVYGASGTRLNDVTVWGGIAQGEYATYLGRVSGCFSVDHNIVNGAGYNLDKGITMGTKVQGIHATNFSFTGNVGAYVPAGGVGTDGFALTNPDITGLAYAVQAENLVRGLTINGGFLFGSTGGIRVAKQNGCAIQGVTVTANTPASGVGLTIDSDAVNFGPCVATGNVFFNWATAVNLTATSNRNVVTPNGLQGNTADVADAGTSNIVGLSATKSIRKGDDSAACNLVTSRGFAMSSTC